MVYFANMNDYQDDDLDDELFKDAEDFYISIDHEYFSSMVTQTL